MNKIQIDQCIDQVLKGMYRDYPELLEKFGERGKIKCREDNYHHFKHLQTAYELGEDRFFIDYAHWLTNLLVARGMKAEHIIDNFERIQKALQTDESKEAKSFKEMLAKAIKSIEKGAGR